MTTTDLYALDSNIVIYLHENDVHSVKRTIAEELTAGNPLISPQVISEYLNVCHKRLKITKTDTLESLMSWLPYCNLIDHSIDIYPEAIKLMRKYQFQLFDAIIVSYSLISHCSILYSEDMQHNLLVEKKLRIVNPFK